VRLSPEDRKPGGGTEETAVDDASRAARPGPGPFVLSCATLVSDVIESAQGEELGKLEHVMLDVPSGRVAYAVLARGGVLGLGAKLFAIPWEALWLDAKRGCLVLDIERERLESAPGFDHEHWPSMGDEAWAARVHEFFAVRGRAAGGDS